MMTEELFQDLAKIKIPHPVKNKDQKPVGKKLKAFIISLYAKILAKISINFSFSFSFITILRI